MWKEQLVLLALLAALFPTASTQSQNHFEDDDIDDDCHLKTSVVLHKLDNCEKEKMKDDFKRNQLWINVVKETIGAMMKQHQEESKSQMEQLTNKLEKLEQIQNDNNRRVEEINMKSNKIFENLEKLENIQNSNKERIEELVNNKTYKIGEQMTQMDRKIDVLQTQAIKAEQAQNKSDGRIDDLNTQTKIISEHLKKVEKIEETLGSVKMQVQDIALYVKPIPICKRWLQTQNLNRTHFFKAEGKYFYFNTTAHLNWNGAHDWCVEREMKMAMLKTQIQLNAVTREVKERNADSNFFWLGASDVGQTAGQFRWEDGTLVDGTVWHNGKIYKHHGDWNERTCVEFYTGYARLSDERCSRSQRILCQVPAALAACL